MKCPLKKTLIRSKNTLSNFILEFIYASKFARIRYFYVFRDPDPGYKKCIKFNKIGLKLPGKKYNFSIFN